MNARNGMHDRIPYRRRHRLYRLPRFGLIAGICAGIGEFLDIKAWKIRCATLICLLFFPTLTLMAYGLGWILVKRRPTATSQTDKCDKVHVNLSEISSQQATLEQRLQRIEEHVTSSHYDLNRKIKDLL